MEPFYYSNNLLYCQPTVIMFGQIARNIQNTVPLYNAFWNLCQKKIIGHVLQSNHWR